MSEHVYKVVKLVGSSKESIEDAIDCALDKASDSVEHMRWFEVEETRGQIEDGGVNYYQVVLEVGFTVGGEDD